MLQETQLNMAMDSMDSGIVCSAWARTPRWTLSDAIRDRFFIIHWQRRPSLPFASVREFEDWIDHEDKNDATRETTMADQQPENNDDAELMEEMLFDGVQRPENSNGLEWTELMEEMD